MALVLASVDPQPSKICPTPNRFWKRFQKHGQWLATAAVILFAAAMATIVWLAERPLPAMYRRETRPTTTFGMNGSAVTTRRFNKDMECRNLGIRGAKSAVKYRQSTLNLQ